MADQVLEGRILDFAHNAGARDFGELALALFETQYDNLPGYRRHCEALGKTPASIVDWREIPQVGKGDFGASATSNSTEFAREIVRTSLPGLFTPDAVSLIVDAESVAETEAVMETLAGEAPRDSLVSRGLRLDAKKLRSWLGARQRDHRPVRVFAAAAGFASLVDLLERRALKFRLPPGSEAFCLTPIEAAEAASWDPSLAARLGLAPEVYRRVLCRRATSTPLLGSTGAMGMWFRFPHWARVTSSDAQHFAILDLASIDTPAHRIEPVPAQIEADGDSHTLVLA
ncbi:MAG: hypothetical protein GY769_11140 [bacterium]|nr:hypothetical protein [bacterium]